MCVQIYILRGAKQIEKSTGLSEVLLDHFKAYIIIMYNYAENTFVTHGYRIRSKPIIQSQT